MAKKMASTHHETATQAATTPGTRQHLSLTARVSLSLVLIAIIPLFIAIISITFISRPELINQRAEAMRLDADNHMQLMDAYFMERLHDIETISRLPFIHRYLGGDSNAHQEVLDELSAGDQRDANYDSWSLFNSDQILQVSYPTPPKKHGHYYILPDNLAAMRSSHQASISDVFYNPNLSAASVDIYTPIMTPNAQIVGFVRATLRLDYIYTIVNNQGDNDGSYGEIIDQHGMRIACTNTDPSNLTQPTSLFTAITPLSPVRRQQIIDENLYGYTTGHIRVFADQQLAQIHNNARQHPPYELIPAEQQQKFEVVWAHSSIPAISSWTYYIFSPLSTITAIADQQLQYIFYIAALVLIVAGVMGLELGKRITQPVLQSIEQQQRLNQLKDQILLNVSHELRTPLTEVYGYLELLLEYQGKLDEKTHTTFLKHALRGSEELQLLITNVLDTVRIDSQPRSPLLHAVPLAQTLRDVLELFDPRTLQNYDLSLQIPENIIVQADQEYLRQILRNLLSNAFKYSPQETKIVVKTSSHDCSRRTDTPPVVCISVKDSGPGILTSDIPLLFEKFVRLKHDLSSSIRGTGLGLYISKQLVEAMGGQIWVESTGITGEGSIFSFTLPLVVKSEIENEIADKANNKKHIIQSS